jgi:hypothetical protein
MIRKKLKAKTESRTESLLVSKYLQLAVKTGFKGRILSPLDDSWRQLLSPWAVATSFVVSLGSWVSSIALPCEDER